MRSIPTVLGPMTVRVTGEGPPIVLWHSLFVDGRSFDDLLPHLPGRTLIVVDAPDHGTSAGPEDGRAYDLERCADAAEELLDALGHDTVDWVGNAFGGHVGVILATRTPCRLRRLVAIASPMQPISGRARIAALIALYATVGVVGPVHDGLLDALLHPDHRPDHARYVAAAARGPGRRRMLRAMRSVMWNRPSLVERLGEVQVPTLFITGAGNPEWPEELARAHAAALPDGELAVIPGVRHLAPLEDPAATGGSIRRWLDEGRADRAAS